MPGGGRCHCFGTGADACQWAFLSFFALFEIGSLLCATAVDSNMFICGRAVAGAGGAGIILGAFSIVSYLIPLHQRPRE